MLTPNYVFHEPTPAVVDIDDSGDFDFVFIERDLEGRITDDEDDGDSYDYCEDVCSILSNTYNEQESNDNASLLSNDSSSPTTDLKESVLTVPSALMKDLDEAHEAAKLIRITDPEESSVVGAMPVGEEKESNESVSSDELITPTDIATQDSPQELFTESLEKTPNPAAYNPTAVSTTGRTIIFLTALPKEFDPSAKQTGSGLLFSKQEDEYSTKDSNKNKHVSNSVSISRTSNKKRRKKLKMLKKAQAVSAAAERMKQQISSSSSSTGKVSNKYTKRAGTASSNKKQLSTTSSRVGSKKATNIAVSCAMETMANYRDELSRQQGKQGAPQVFGS